MQGVDATERDVGMDSVGQRACFNAIPFNQIFVYKMIEKLVIRTGSTGITAAVCLCGGKGGDAACCIWFCCCVGYRLNKLLHEL